MINPLFLLNPVVLLTLIAILSFIVALLFSMVRMLDWAAQKTIHEVSLNMGPPGGRPTPKKDFPVFLLFYGLAAVAISLALCFRFGAL